jgi:hypothetical protein
MVSLTEEQKKEKRECKDAFNEVLDVVYGHSLTLKSFDHILELQSMWNTNKDVLHNNATLLPYTLMKDLHSKITNELIKHPHTKELWNAYLVKISQFRLNLLCSLCTS